MPSFPSEHQNLLRRGPCPRDDLNSSSGFSIWEQFFASVLVPRFQHLESVRSAFLCSREIFHMLSISLGGRFLFTTLG